MIVYQINKVGQTAVFEFALYAADMHICYALVHYCEVNIAPIFVISLSPASEYNNRLYIGMFSENILQGSHVPIRQSESVPIHL